MNDDYYRCDLTIHVTSQEADAIIDAMRISNDLSGGELGAPVVVPDIDSAFRAHYPGTPEDPLADFFALFSDRQWPIFGTSATIVDRCDDGTVELRIAGEDIEVDSLSQLLFNSACSALPIQLSYNVHAFDHEPAPYRSGFVIITDMGCIFGLSLDTDYGAFGTGYIIAAETDDDDEPLVFWNSDDGFGDALSATLFAFHEDGLHCLPLGSTRWMSLPLPPTDTPALMSAAA